MPQLSPYQINKFKRLASIIDDKEFGIVREISAIEDKVISVDKRVDEVDTTANKALKIAEETSKKEGPAGHTPVAGVDFPLPKDGNDYVITSKDYAEIAKSVKVEIPIVEKVIETVIVKEQPIVTNEIVKEIVQTFDSSEIDNKIIELERELEGLKKIPRPLIGGRVGVQILGSGSKVGTKVNEINFGTGLSVSIVNGRVTVTAASSSGSQQPLSGTVNGTNKTYTWTTAPTVIVVDQGRSMQKVSSDGTVNWTGTTSTILAIAPTFDIYAPA